MILQENIPNKLTNIGLSCSTLYSFNHILRAYTFSFCQFVCEVYVISKSSPAIFASFILITVSSEE